MVERRYVLIGVEGNHDQAFIERVLYKSFGLQKLPKKDSSANLDKYWRKLIPKYPPLSGDLYQRLDMPSILENEELSIAIYAGGGNKMADRLNAILSNSINLTKLFAFAIIADSDKKTPSKVASDYKEAFEEILPNFLDEPGAISSGDIRLGIYVLPDNKSQGVLDTVLCQCGVMVYPDFMEQSIVYLSYFSEEKRREKDVKWKPFDYEKAQVATVVSVLKPGKTNTASLADNKWVSEETLEKIPALIQLNVFFRELLF